MLVALGLCMVAISILVLVYYKDRSAFKVDLIVALTIVGLGVLMRFGKKSKKAYMGSPSKQTALAERLGGDL